MPATRAVYACAKMADEKRGRAMRDSKLKTPAVQVS